jgi:hypothetical protein
MKYTLQTLQLRRSTFAFVISRAWHSAALASMRVAHAVCSAMLNCAGMHSTVTARPDVARATLHMTCTGTDADWSPLPNSSSVAVCCCCFRFRCGASALNE